MNIRHICVRPFYLASIFVAVSLSINAQTYDFAKEASRWQVNDSLSTISPDSIIRIEYPIQDSINQVANGEPFSISNNTDSHSHIPTSITIDTNMSVGEISFSSGVSPTGAVTYNIPINTIAGRSGFQPNISIAYNSQGGDDVLGYGWTIAGLSSICRVNKSIYYDGQTAPIALNCDDAFMLDGVRLLPTGNQVYTYVPEQGNMRIEANVVSSGTITSFTVEYSNGSIGTFGYTNNISYPMTRLQDANGNYMDFTYEMIDNRNYIKTIEYGAHSSLPMGHLSTIEFIYKSRTDTISGYQSGVELKLTQLLEKIRCYDKGDVLRTYSFTYQEGKVSLLTQINQNNLNPLRFYYGYSDGNTSKTFIKQEATLDTYFDQKIPVVVSKGKFSYGADDDGLIIYPDKNPCALFYQPSIPGHHSKAYYYSEFSPEQDLLINLYLNSSSPIAAVLKAEEGFQTLLSADIDGVPGEEVIKINNVEIDGEDELRVKVYKSYLPSTLYLKSEFTYRSTGVPHNDGRSFWPKIYLPGDYNGDGKMELLTVSMMYPLDRQGLESECCLIDLSANKILFNRHIFNFDVQNSQIIPLDVDGDGKTDICHIHTGGTDVYRFTNVNGSYALSKFFTYTGLKYSSVKNRVVMLGDVNGDGKADIVVSPSKSYTQWGSKMVETRTQDCCPECYADYPNSPICPECNADIGYSNYCAICGCALIGGVECPEHGFYYPVEMMIPYHNGTVWSSYISTGVGFVKKEQDLIECNDEYNYVLQDVNSDGIADLVECGYAIRAWFNEYGEFKNCNDFVGGMSGYNVVPSSIVKQNYHCFLLATDGPKLCKINCTVNESKQRLLTGTISSLGVVQKNYYQRINDSDTQNNFYHQGHEAIFPYEDFQGPLWAASQQKKTLNEVCVNDLTYSYGKAIWHRQGLGFRGFTNTYSYDLLRNRENSAQTFDPYKMGALVKEVTPTSETNYTNYMSVASNKKVVVRPTNVLTKDLLKGTYVTRNISYDDYNNPTFEQIQYNDNVTSNVIKTEVSYTYKNLATFDNYLIGLPLTQTTTEYRDGDTWTQSEEIEYKDNTTLPKRKISKNNGNQVNETQWIYSSYGNVLAERSMTFSSTVLLGKTFIYDYDWRFLSEETDALGHTTIYSSYNKFGYPRKVKNFKQKTTTYDYDGFGRASSVHNPDGTVESTTYTWDKTVGAYYITQSITGKPLVRVYYDALNREVRKGEQRFDGVWQYVDTQYDDYGRISKISNPFRSSSSHWTTNSYDDYDRLISVAEPSGKVTTTNYSGNSVTVVQNGISTTQSYDKSGLLVTVSDPAGDIAYDYRPDKQLNKVVAPGNIETSFDYDSYGRQTKLVDPSAGIKTSGYDDSGNVNELIDANGKVVRMSYDIYNRLRKREYVGEQTTEYTYNSDGMLILEQNSNGVRKEYLYDAFFRLYVEKEFSGAEGRNLMTMYTYENGNVSMVDFFYVMPNDGVATGMGYESYIYTYGTLSEIKWNGNTSVWKLTEENALGLPTLCLTGGLTRHYIYDVDGKPNTRVVRFGNNKLQDFMYNFSPQNGNLLWRRDIVHNKLENFEYDNLNRLITYGGKRVSYDLKGNITQLSGIGTLEYSADKPYSVSSVLPAVNCRIPSAGQSVTYNAMMRPTLIAQNGYNASFIYDGDGNRVQMNLQKPVQVPISDGNWTNHYYLGDRYEVIDNLSESVHKEILYIGGDAYSAPAVSVKEGDNPWILYYICRDHLGSITHIVDESGAVKQELSYDAWGNLRNPQTQVVYAAGSEPELFLGRGYAGHEHLTAFGLINMNARLYDPYLGRFLSPDRYVQMPDFTQSFNRYSYCLNNPLSYVDQDGNIWFVIGGLLIGAYIGASLQSHSMNPAKWSSDWWKGATIGGVIGAATGGVIGAMWAAGATISVGFSSWGISVPLITFTPATATVGGITTVSIGGGLGLGSGLTFALSKDKNKDLDKQTFDPNTDPLYKAYMESKQQAEPFDWKTVAGLAVSQAAETRYSETWGTWTGKNGKTYNTNWGGNQYTGGRSAAKKAAAKLGRVAKGLGLWGVGESIYDYINGDNSGVGVVLDTGFGLYSTFGGYLGAGTGIFFELGKKYGGPIYHYLEYKKRNNY